MKFTDIDTNNGWIKIQGKGGKERVVRIGECAQKALWTHLTWRLEG
jgi:site-specific recombinase XerD